MPLLEILALGFALGLPRPAAVGRWLAVTDAFLLAAVTAGLALATLP